MTQEIPGRAASAPAFGAGSYAHGGQSIYHEPSETAYQTAPEEGELGGILRWSGALMSLALVAGMGVWGWQLATRDVNGVPVVLALEGPMRITPDSPGGAAIPHQGLAVNAVQEERGSTPVPDQLRVLDEPDSLSNDDMVTVAMTTQAPDRRGGAEQGLADQNLALIDRLVSQAVDGATPLGVLAPDLESTPDAAQDTPAPAVTVAAAPVIVPGGMGRSPRPPQRPAMLAAQPILASVSPATTVVPTPATIPSGSRLVQLGAFDSPDRARAAWAQLQAGEFGPLLEGKAQVVQEAISGGRTFYRLRASGFADLDDARRFCAALKSGRADCIPVRAR